MLEIISDNIISPLGFSSAQNYTAATNGMSAIKETVNIFDSGIDTAAAVINNQMLDDAFADSCMLNPDKYTKVEKAAMLSIKSASELCDVKLNSDKTAFYISSTKGNVELLDHGDFNNPDINLWYTANKITKYFGNPNTPIVVSNACISGLSAIISAARAIDNNRIDCAVVTGVDMLSRFIILGFSSLKALSPTQCRPFDIDRNGLNLGEAAATIIMRRATNDSKFPKFFNGIIHNDAYHISSPSKTAEGSYRCIRDVMQCINKQDLAFINTHGTSTLYNDEMEAVAISRSGLQNIPANSLKPIFGHTLGAAGILESIISIKALQNSIILPTLNFTELGVSKKININNNCFKTNGKLFLKMISGFGGCNAAAIFKKGE